MKAVSQALTLRGPLAKILLRWRSSSKQENADYVAALDFVRRKSREEGIDAALGAGGRMLDGPLVPIHAEGGAACQIAAKAGLWTPLNLLAQQAHKNAWLTFMI